MIGRDGPVRPFDLIRWARQQASGHGLSLLEAHVLLVLSTYANDDAVAWPSIKTLALDSGLRPTRDGRNSAVSAALARLGDVPLVWTVQGGHGYTARRELLFNPAAQQPPVPAAGTEHHQSFLMTPVPDPAAPTQPAPGPVHNPVHNSAVDLQPSGLPDGLSPQPSAVPEGSISQPSGVADVQPSALADQNYQGKDHLERPEGTDQRSLPATRKASGPDSRMAEQRQAVRDRILDACRTDEERQQVIAIWDAAA